MAAKSVSEWTETEETSEPPDKIPTRSQLYAIDNDITTHVHKFCEYIESMGERCPNKVRSYSFYLFEDIPNCKAYHYYRLFKVIDGAISRSEFPRMILEENFPEDDGVRLDNRGYRELFNKLTGLEERVKRSLEDFSRLMPSGTDTYSVSVRESMMELEREMRVCLEANCNRFLQLLEESRRG